LFESLIFHEPIIITLSSPPPAEAVANEPNVPLNIRFKKFTAFPLYDAPEARAEPLPGHYVGDETWLGRVYRCDPVT
jgi:hypothetical protein